MDNIILKNRHVVAIRIVVGDECFVFMQKGFSIVRLPDNFSLYKGVLMPIVEYDRACTESSGGKETFYFYIGNQIMVMKSDISFWIWE